MKMGFNMFGDLRGMEGMLNYHLQRHNLLASNVANAEPPNFRPRELLFDKELTTAVDMMATDNSHYGIKAENVSQTRDHFVEERGDPVSPDKNGVYIEKAMGRLSANKIRYNASAEIVKRRLAILRYAATNGGR